jgi:acetyltransferase-like isoleucine patch superfamily enzyme
MANALINTYSGFVTVEDFAFAGHDVLIITGTHDINVAGEQRMYSVPMEGRDIHIGKAVWLGSRSVILGPSTIGDYAVVAAGAVVIGDVPAYAVVGGVPARVIRTLDPSSMAT